jgi:hypothetical protein
MILKWKLHGVGGWDGIRYLRIVSNEHGNEPSDAIKARTFFHKLDISVNLSRDALWCGVN